MLVDNAIVLVENVYRHLELGKSLKEASIVGTNEVALAVIASTATTVTFALFLTGTGSIYGLYAQTIIIVLIASLVVAIGALQSYPSLKNRWREIPTDDDDLSEVVPTNAVMANYVKLLNWAISHRWLTASIGAATLIGTFMLYGAFNAGVEFFPETGLITRLSRCAPDGTDLRATTDWYGNGKFRWRVYEMSPWRKQGLLVAVTHSMVFGQPRTKHA